MIVLRNIPIILFSITCSHALAIEPRTKPAVQMEGDQTLGGVVELVVNANSLENRYVDLDTGTVFSYPKNMNTDSETEEAWLEQKRIDMSFLSVDRKQSRIVFLWSSNMIAAPVSEDKWSCTEEELMLEAKKAEWEQRFFPAESASDSIVAQTDGDAAYPTFVFKTREGSAGVLQVLEILRNGQWDRQAKMRYWLLRNPSVKIEDDQIIWGQAVDGIVCAVKPAKESFLAGETLEFHIVYRNVSDRPVTICTYPDEFYVWARLWVVDSSGTVVASGQHANGLRPPINSSDFVTLQPGQTASVREKIAGSIKGRPRLKAGRYAAKASINEISKMQEHVIGFDEFCRKNNLETWTGTIKSGPSAFVILSNNDLSWSEAVEGDFHITRQKLLRLLALPEPQLRHARKAIELFKAQQDWPSLAIAYEVAAETMWRITHMAPEAFTRPVTEQATDVRNPGFRGGPYVMVQINLDGKWFKGRGERQNWIEDIQRKQEDLVLERIAALKKLGALCLDRLDDPARAVLAYEATSRGVPVCTEALETLIAQMWPVLKVQKDEVLALDHVGAAHLRLEPLQRLAEAQVVAGNLRGAADTRLRAMLTAMIGDRGDWNAHYPMQEAEAFWKVVRRLPLDQPLPPTLWLRVLDPQHAEITIIAPEDDPHGYPISYPGPRLVIRPGHTARTLTVAADMETPGGSGGVRCFSIIKGKGHDLGSVRWHTDGRRGREWRQGTFDLPEDVGIIRLAITPFNGTEFHVRNLKIEVAFAAGNIKGGI